jgi:DNA polymerase-4
LWGVGEVTAAKLHHVGIGTVGEVAALSESALVSIVGLATGRQLHALAHNRDPRRVQPRRRRRSIGAQCALGRRRRSAADVDAVLLGLVDRVTRRMRAARRIGRTVVLRLRFDDFSRATRSFTVREATAETQAIVDIARALLATEAPTIARRGLTLVGVAVTNLENDAPVQLAFPLDRRGTIALDFAVDEIRERFGLSAITRAVLLGRETGWSMPLLPD